MSDDEEIEAPGWNAIDQALRPIYAEGGTHRIPPETERLSEEGWDLMVSAGSQQVWAE